MLSRNQQQEKMMQSVYSYLFYQKSSVEPDIKSIMEGIFECDFSEIDTYSKESVVKTLLNQEVIDELIKNNLSEKLKLERLNICAHAILLIAIGEYQYVKEINKSEIINVAVTLAKKYLDDGEYRFVNAILDKVL